MEIIVTSKLFKISGWVIGSRSYWKRGNFEGNSWVGKYSFVYLLLDLLVEKNAKLIYESDEIRA